MTNNDLIKLLQAGKVQEFNQFREDNPDFKIDLRGAELIGVKWNAFISDERANFKGANFEGASLSYARLIHANFEGANFKGARLYSVILNYSNLIGANFEGAKLYNAKLYNASLCHAIFDKEQIAMLPELLGIKVIEDKQ